MVEPSFLALTTTPSMTGSAAELTLPASATADWDSAGAARPSWSRTAAVAAVEASNALRIRMAFPFCLELVELGIDGSLLTVFMRTGGTLARPAGNVVLDDLLTTD